MTLPFDRKTARIEGDFVLFLIGARFNRPWNLLRCSQVAVAFRRMMLELEAAPEIGYLGGESWFGRKTIAVQYWRSVEQLIAYARQPNGTHVTAWQRFNQTVGRTKAVGIWHETYLIRAGSYECIFGNMPPFGLSAVGTISEPTGPLGSALLRLGREDGGSS